MTNRNLLRLRPLCEKLGGISPATVYRRINDGTLPPPKKFGSLSVWFEDEIEAVLADLTESGSEAA